MQRNLGKVVTVQLRVLLHINLYIYYKKKMKIGIIGNGFVGKATKILGCKDVELIIFDIVPELYSPIGTNLKDICKCELIFISVPTPMNKDGSCYLEILHSVIDNLKQYADFNDSLVIIRSTAPPGTSKFLNCFFMPEFLTEKNFENDFINCKKWIFGLKETHQDLFFKEKINKLFSLAHKNNKIKYNTVHFVTNGEAEMIKMFRNKDFL